MSSRTYTISEECMKTHSWFTLAKNKQPNDLDTNLTWTIGLEKDLEKYGLDIKSELETVLNYELNITIKDAVLKRIMNSIDVYDIKIKNIINKEDITTISLDDCTHVVASPTVVALIERMLKFKLDTTDVDVSCPLIGLTKIGYVKDVKVFRDTLCPRDYILKLNWDKELPLLKAHIELSERKVKVTTSDFDPNILKPELILLDVDVLTSAMRLDTFLY